MKEEEEQEEEESYKKYKHYKKKAYGERKKEEEESYKKYKHYKKKAYGEAHIGKEWDSDDESSDSNCDDVTTVAIKGSTSSSSKSLFPNLNKENILASWQRRVRRR
jgi:hypothetical protein